jgi:hypothetical protein
MSEIGDLHNTLTQESFNQLLEKTLSKWDNDSELKSFVKYFKRQWINSSFSNWQLFKTPVGLAMTNSPIERYNREIKSLLQKD